METFHSEIDNFFSKNLSIHYNLKERHCINCHCTKYIMKYNIKYIFESLFSMFIICNVYFKKITFKRLQSSTTFKDKTPFTHFS